MIASLLASVLLALDHAVFLELLHLVLAKLFELAAEARTRDELREEDLQHQLVERTRRRVFEPGSHRLLSGRRQAVELLVGAARLAHHSAPGEPRLDEPRQDRVELTLRGRPDMPHARLDSLQKVVARALALCQHAQGDCLGRGELDSPSRSSPHRTIRRGTAAKVRRAP